MPENGHLNGSQDGGEKGYFWTLKMDFPSFPDFGLCRGRGGVATLERTDAELDLQKVFRNYRYGLLSL